MSYRGASAADAAALDRLFDDVFCETFAHLYRPEDLEAFLSGFTVGDWEEQLASENYAFRVAEAAGELVGFLKLGPLKIPVQTKQPALLLDQLYVRHQHRGAGIAHTLMEWALDEARRRSAEELYLTVFIDNHRARRFYDRYGFVPVGRYDFMVGNHVDEDVIMRKSL